MSHKFYLEKIYSKILEVYPFLNKNERFYFEKNARGVIERSLRDTKKDIKALLDILKNPHAYLWVWKKPSLSHIRKKRKFSYNIKDRILSFVIPSWSGEVGILEKKLIDVCVKNAKRYNGIIIDVRNNKGGNSRIAHRFASIFFQDPYVYGKFIKRGDGGKLYSSLGKLNPNEEIFVSSPMVILISRKCCSSNELFLAPFRLSNRAVLVGQPTRGGSGNPIVEEVIIKDKKIMVLVPTWRFLLRGQKRPIEETKINPHILYTGANIKQFARKILKEKMSKE